MKPIPPFDFDLTARTFMDTDGEIRSYRDGVYRQAITLRSQPVLLEVSGSGTIDNPGVDVNLRSDPELSKSDRIAAEETVATIFNFGLDLNRFYADTGQDPTMRAVTKALHGLKSRSTPDPYQALVESILEQQISLIVAHSLLRRLIKTFGTKLVLEGVTCYAFPEPEQLSAVSVEDLRSCGLSWRKAEYVQGISRMVASGALDLTRLRNYEDPDEIIREMDQVRGIGVWTAEFTMLRGMQKFEALPADDLGLKHAIAHYYRSDAKITGAEARAIAEKWGRWKGLATFYLVVAERTGITV